MSAPKDTAGSAGLEVADVLERAAEKLSEPGVWGCKHCAATAIWAGYGKFLGSSETLPAQKVFANYLGIDAGDVPYSIYRWNDASERTQQEVVDALKAAAALSRAGKSS